jgi:hypothetical protein
MNDKLKHIKQSGFKAPYDYFNNLEDAVFTKIKKKSAIDAIDKPGFTVPKNYFSTIENKVTDTLKKDDLKIKSLVNRRNLFYLTGIAAALVLMFSIFKPDNEFTFDSIDTELVDSYIETQHINATDLAMLWDETEINDITFDEFEYLDADVENYILNNSHIEDLIID